LHAGPAPGGGPGAARLACCPPHPPPPSAPSSHPPPPPTPPPRYQKFYSLTRGGGAYRSLLSPDDEASLPLLSAFQRLAVYKRVEMPPEALTGRALTDHYDGLIAKYIGRDRLYF
jgi:hypothetical protein